MASNKFCAQTANGKDFFHNKASCKDGCCHGAYISNNRNQRIPECVFKDRLQLGYTPLASSVRT